MGSGIVREVVNFYKLFWRTPDSERQIIVYVEEGSYRAYLDGIIKELTGTYKQTICYITSDPNDSMYTSPERGIRPFYLNVLLSIFMLVVKCKVFVITLTDLNQFHLKRSTYPVHYVYVFHSLVSTHMVFRKGAFNYYDSILCAGPHHVREIRKCEELHELRPKTLVEAGYYRLERIYSAYQEFSRRRRKTGKPVVLIAPSWGKDNIIESCGDALISALLSEDYAIIVRPHPETTKRSPQVIRALEKKFGADPNFFLELSVATDDSLLRSDVLISDYSGVALEYALGTERPVLFMDVPLKVNNADYEEIGLEPIEVSLRSQIGLIVSPDEPDLVPQRIAELIKVQGANKQKFAELRRKHVYSFGHSSEIGAKHIMDVVRGS